MTALAAIIDAATNLRTEADAIYRRAEQMIISAIGEEIRALEGVTWTGLDASEEGTVLHYGAMTIGGKAVDVDVRVQMSAPARWTAWVDGRYGSADTAAGAMAKARAAWVKR